MVEHCEISLDVTQRINIAFGSMITSALSIFGALGVIVLILIGLRKNKKIRNDQQQQQQNLLDVTSQQFQRSLSNTSISNYSTVSGSGLSSIPKTNSLMMISTLPNSELSHSLSSQSISSISSSGSLNYSTSHISLNHLSNVSNTNSIVNSRKKKNGTKLSHFVVNLSIADFLASSFICLSRWMMTKSNNKFIKSATDSRNLSLCTITNGVVSFAFLSSFIWTWCISMHIYRQFNQSSYIKNEKKWYTRHMTWIYYILGWVLPFTFGIGIMMSSFIESGDGMPFCQINAYTLLLLYYIPMLLSLVTSIILTFKVKKRFQQVSKQSLSFNRSNLQQKVINRLNLFVFVFFICWSPNILTFLIRLFGDGCQIYIIEFISNIASPSQGFLNFICYIYSNSTWKFKDSKFYNLLKKFKNNNPTEQQNENNSFYSSSFRSNESNNNEFIN